MAGWENVFDETGHFWKTKMRLFILTSHLSFHFIPFLSSGK